MFGGKKSGAKSLTRAQQIDSLQAELRTAQVKVKPIVEGSEYEVEIVLVDANKRLPIMILLPPEFPQGSSPVVRMGLDVTHPLLNN